MQAITTGHMSEMWQGEEDRPTYNLQVFVSMQCKDIKDPAAKTQRMFPPYNSKYIVKDIGDTLPEGCNGSHAVSLVKQSSYQATPDTRICHGETPQ